MGSVRGHISIHFFYPRGARAFRQRAPVDDLKNSLKEFGNTRILADSTISESVNLTGSARVDSYLYMTLLVTRACVVSARFSNISRTVLKSSEDENFSQLDGV